MSNDFFGGFDFNHDGHISRCERAAAFHYMDSMSSGNSGSRSRYSGSGNCVKSGSRPGSGSRNRINSGSRVYPRTHRPDFCNIYGGYYAWRKDSL